MTAVVVALAVATASRWSRTPLRAPHLPLAPIDDRGLAERADPLLREPGGDGASGRGRFVAAVPVSGCHGTLLYQWTSPATKPSVTSSMRVTINRPVADVARALDPQSWSQCSKFFVKSYLAVDPGAGTGDPTADTPVAPGTAYPSTAVVPGTPYPWRLFFEHYDGHCKTGACWYRNLLDVRTWYEGSGSSYHVRYDLHRYMSGTQRIKIDGGNLTVEPGSTSGTADVTASKTLEFDSVLATGVAAAVFRQPDATKALTELACCDVPSS